VQLAIRLCILILANAISTDLIAAMALMGLVKKWFGRLRLYQTSPGIRVKAPAGFILMEWY